MLICPFSQQEATPTGLTFRSLKTMTSEWAGVLSEISHVDYIPTCQRSHFSPVHWALKQVVLLGPFSLSYGQGECGKKRENPFFGNGKSLVALINILPLGNIKKDQDMKIVDGMHHGRQMIYELHLSQTRSPHRTLKGNWKYLLIEIKNTILESDIIHQEPL